MPVVFSAAVSGGTDHSYVLLALFVMLAAAKLIHSELQTLLMKAAFTQSSYAIIGQGLVETILNLRPEDRRDLIEEAADIQRYRLKIEEAQDRLKATHENVERVKLLMKEIAPRLSQLERQARRAGDHARLSHQLSAALRADRRAWVAERRKAARPLIDLASTRLRNAGVPARALGARFCGPVSEAGAADEILRLARANRCRTVVVARHTRSWLGSLFGGDLRTHLASRTSRVAIWGIG